MNRVRLAVAGSLAAVLVTGMGATAAHADPDTVEEARQELARIQEEASTIDQELIQAHERAAAAEEKLKTLSADLKAQEEKVAEMADQMGDVATMQLQQDSFGMTTQLLTSGSSDTFLSGLATYQSEIDRANAGVQQFQLDQAKLATLREDAEATEAALKKDEAAKEDLADEYDAMEAEAQKVYDRLSEEERQRLAELEAQREAEAAAAATARAEEADTTSRSRSASETTTPVVVDTSGRAAGAVSAALTKVGSSYVWGTSGPNTFDCSGLTSWAYRQVGITLSRSSSAQWSGAGRKVSVSEIQPGDLVFYYSPVSHVGMYIGNGMIVHAANPRSGVNTTGLYSMPLTGVRRVIG